MIPLRNRRRQDVGAEAPMDGFTAFSQRDHAGRAPPAALPISCCSVVPVLAVRERAN
jgi:hypothetical protein